MTLHSLELPEVRQIVSRGHLYMYMMLYQCPDEECAIGAQWGPCWT